MGATTLTLQNTGGTDHISFNELGIPGFQFIQDDIHYNTRTHHTSMDNYDHLIADDLKQMAIIVASFVYNIGESAFIKSTMLTLINNSNFPSAASQFNRWIYDNGKEIKGLVNRRAKKKLYS